MARQNRICCQLKDLLFMTNDLWSITISFHPLHVHNLTPFFKAPTASPWVSESAIYLAHNLSNMAFTMLNKDSKNKTQQRILFWQMLRGNRNFYQLKHLLLMTKGLWALTIFFHSLHVHSLLGCPSPAFTRHPLLYPTYLSFSKISFYLL